MAIVQATQVDWKHLLKDTSTLVMWFKSSGLFLRTHGNLLQEILNRGGSVTAVVPDYENKALMALFAEQYATQYKDPLDARDTIERTVCLLKNVGAKILLHDKIIHYPAYVTDTKYLVGLHEFGKVDTITSPCFVCQRDEFIDSQVSFLTQNSRSFVNNQ